MNSTPLISIIVPVYNTEQYLPKCIESIQKQTLSDLEIIIVDDGSTDGSLTVCQNFAFSDNRIRVFHKENGGQSSARNLALNYISAPYIGFVDSDDYIDAQMYEQLYKAIQEFDADIATCGVLDIYEKRTRIRTKKDTRYVLESVQACEMALNQRLDSTILPNKLFKSELFDNLRFPEGKIMEDDFIFTRLILSGNRVAIITKPYYYYIHRPNSTTTASFRMRDLDPIDAYEQNYDFIKNQYPELKSVMESRKCWARFYALDKLYLSDSEKKHKDLEKELHTYLIKKKNKILFGSFFSPLKKFGFILLLIHPRLYKHFLQKRWGQS